MSHSDDRHPLHHCHDLHEIISTITHQLTGLGKDASVVTLAGSNKGAIMKADRGGLLDDNATDNKVNHHGEDSSSSKLSAYTNSNYQAVNNSIMVDGRCEAEDPGVHFEIVDCIDIQEDGDYEHMKAKKKDKKEKNEKKGTDQEEDEEAGDHDEHEKEGKKKKEKN